MKYFPLLLLLSCKSISFVHYQNWIYETDSVYVKKTKSYITKPYAYFNSIQTVEDYMNVHTYSIESENIIFHSVLTPFNKQWKNKQSLDQD
jgi:hypothetical protein